MNYDAQLRRQFERLSTPRFLTSKAEVVDYYQEHHGRAGTKDSWKKAIVSDLAAITGDKPKTLEKRFEKRINAPEKRNAADYRQLGEQIGPLGRKPPKGGYEVYFVLDIKISNKCGNIREHSEILTGSAAYDFANGAGFDKLMRIYFKGNVAENICHIHELEVRELND